MFTVFKVCTQPRLPKDPAVVHRSWPTSYATRNQNEASQHIWKQEVFNIQQNSSSLSLSLSFAFLKTYIWLFVKLQSSGTVFEIFIYRITFKVFHFIYHVMLIKSCALNFIIPAHLKSDTLSYWRNLLRFPLAFLFWFECRQCTQEHLENLQYIK